MSSELPTPRFAIGDKVFFATTKATGEHHDCPDCNKTGKWMAVSPTGVEVPIECPRCGGRKVLTMHGYTATVSGPLTIGQVRMEWPRTSFDSERSAFSYMCEETGIGGGSIYYEDRIYADRDDAQHRADVMAGEQNQKLDENDPQRQRRREIYGYTIEAALKADESDKRRAAEYSYQRLIEGLGELPQQYVSGLTSEQLKAAADAVVEYNDEATTDLAAWRDAA